MGSKRHVYSVETEWTGNHGLGTQSWHVYGRNHVIAAEGKPVIHGSADPSFHGDPTGWNPGELLLASLSACHKLWYLGLCAGAGIVVTAYRDSAEAVMMETRRAMASSRALFCDRLSPSPAAVRSPAHRPFTIRPMRIASFHAR